MAKLSVMGVLVKIYEEIVTSNFNKNCNFRDRKMKLTIFITAVVFYTFVAIEYLPAQETETVRLFPIPQKMEVLPGSFLLDEQSFIAIPANPSSHDVFLSGFLSAELSDHYGFAIKTKPVSQVEQGKKVILMGTIRNPLVEAACRANHIDVNDIKQRPEGYLLRADSNGVLIAGSDESGVFYGLQSLRQLIRKNGKTVSIRGAKVEDWPYKPFRGIRLYMPGKDNIPFFKRFLRDFMAMYKFNTLILEVSTCMRYDKHPEINAGWLDFGRELRYSRRERPAGPKGEYQDSGNHDAGDGGIVEKEDVADVVQYAKQLHINVIPEIPSLTHSYYLLTRHRELAEIQNAEWPDTYCPSNPKSYELLFDVLDECIDVIKPKIIHIGHDEWRMPIDVCPRCKGIPSTKLYAEDVNRIYNHLSKKGVKVALWGDHLVEAVNGKGFKVHVVSKDYSYKLPGALSEEEVKQFIPKDILVFNWFWNKPKIETGGDKGEENDILVEKMGFKQTYGNLLPTIQNWGRRSSRPSVIGGAPSSWAATTEFNFAKDLMFEFLGCENLLWSTHWPDEKELLKMVQQLMPTIRQNLRAVTEPSYDDNPVAAVDITPYFNASSEQVILDMPLRELRPAMVKTGPKFFNLAEPNSSGGKCAIVVGTEGQEKIPQPREVKGIKIGKDASSLIFLHACARPARNEYAYRYVYNFDDTADLLGWYEIVYEDGLVITVPIRYGVNILEWDAYGNKYLYGADAVDCAKAGSARPMSFYAFEWINPRFGRKIEEINLKGSSGFKGLRDKLIKDNAIVVAAISVAEKRVH